VRQLEKGFNLAAAPRQLRVRVDALLRLLALLQRLLRLFLVLPEIRPAGFFFEAGQQFAVAGNVKENSAPVPCVAGAVRIGVVGLRVSLDAIPS
jgi:hypothetical protein